MRKNYLLATACLMTAAAMSASAPEGDLYILGLNGNTTPDASNTLVMQERSADDIDEGVWRWAIDSFDLAQTEGTFTVSDGKTLTLGFDTANEFGFVNDMTAGQNMVYMAPDGPAINYHLPAGECKIFVALFEDIDGEAGKDTWIVQIQTSGGDADDNYYLLGFDGTTTPSATVCFKKTEEVIDGETLITYSIPKFLVGDCPDGFVVYSSLDDADLGLNTSFAAPGTPVTDDAPMAFLSAGGERVICTLTPGYYSVTFSPLGSISMISFLRCEDQTPLDETEYYLIGANGITSASSECKFNREVETYEYEEDGEIIKETSVIYTLKKFGFKNAEAGITVSSADGVVVFGYNSDMAAAFPNDISSENPFALMAINGVPLNCSLTEGNYDISFTITGEGSAMLSFIKSEEGSVDIIDTADDTETYYNLNGQVVMNPQKGIYIVKKGSEIKKIIR